MLSRHGEDAIWARSVGSETITLDGNLDEAVWSQAESLHVAYGTRTGLPTSGWRAEFQEAVYFDQTNATVKFLVDSNNQLYLSFYCPDSSVGGSQDWARWDGVLMSVKDRASDSRTTPAIEYFYTYWYINIDSLITAGAEPRFIGRFGNFGDTTRTQEQRDAWDAGFRVIGGVSNDDTTPDEGYVIEMRLDLGVLGYDVTDADGDIVELNFSIWDCDWVSTGDPTRTATSRTDWQSPWGNANLHNVGRVMARPDVTVNSGALPEIAADIRLPNGANYADAVIDGDLNDDAWSTAYSFNLAFDDSLVRAAYPGVGPWRSGQFQPELEGNPRPPVLDPGFANVKAYFKGDYLYLAADVNDQLVQGTNAFDRLDMIRFIVMDRDSVDSDNRPVTWVFGATFDSVGTAAAYDVLPVMVNDGAAEFAVSLKGATTVNDNTDIDEGYVVEMKVDLKYFGYQAGLGDHLLYMGVMLADGDSFDNPLNDYGSRTWFFRENSGGPAFPWIYMDETLTAIDDEPTPVVANSILLSENYPNPFNPTTTLRYTLPFAGDVSVSVFNILGQEVANLNGGKQAGGVHTLNFDASILASGVYFYHVQVVNPANGNAVVSRTAKMTLVK
ncbi:MAG TPA: T9SS type A sorting domain-containing protein [Calditrichia bacterium]|nr:T9SS type A sorting domain-containing protein [Calditrichia bacterium]